jgi:protein-tyrosine phosphatase
LVDIHCHIVPGVDDGAADIDIALAMIEEAKAVGVTSILTTPHLRAHPDERGTHVDQRKQFDKLVAAAGGYPLYLGGEVRVTGDALAIVEDPYFRLGEGAKWILLELPSQEVPSYFAQTLFEFRLRGITPIVAHPERNSAILKRPSHALDFVRMGAHLQLTASSLTGELGPTIEQFAKALVRAGLVSFVASDAHNVTTRSFRSWTGANEVLKELEMKLAEEGIGQNGVYAESLASRNTNGIKSNGFTFTMTEKITTKNPQAVCDNTDIDDVELDEQRAERVLRHLKNTGFESAPKRKRFFFF